MTTEPKPQPLSIDSQSVDTPQDGVTIDRGVIEVPDVLAHLRVLLEAKLSPHITPSGGLLKRRPCRVVSIDEDAGEVELRFPPGDGLACRYTVDELFGRKKDSP